MAQGQQAERALPCQGRAPALDGVPCATASMGQGSAVASNLRLLTGKESAHYAERCPFCGQATGGLPARAAWQVTTPAAKTVQSGTQHAPRSNLATHLSVKRVVLAGMKPATVRAADEGSKARAVGRLESTQHGRGGPRCRGCGSQQTTCLPAQATGWYSPTTK